MQYFNLDPVQNLNSSSSLEVLLSVLRWAIERMPCFLNSGTREFDLKWRWASAVLNKPLDASFHQQTWIKWMMCLQASGELNQGSSLGLFSFETVGEKSEGRPSIWQFAAHTPDQLVQTRHTLHFTLAQVIWLHSFGSKFDPDWKKWVMAIVSPIAVQVNAYSDIKPGQEQIKAHSVEHRTASF